MEQNIFQIKNTSNDDNHELMEDGNDEWSKISSSSASEGEEKKLTIEYFGTDITDLANKGKLDPVIWRDKEIQQTVYTLLRKTKNNPLLIWEAGVGKTAIVEGLAQKIIENDVPERLRNKRIFSLDIWSLVAWTKYRWEFEARFKSILEEAIDPLNGIILFVDELHTIIWAWNTEGWADASNMLKPFLARWSLQLIGSTTFDEYQKHIEKDSALKRRFQEINVEEPSRDQAIQILYGIKDKMEEHHGVNILDETIDSCVDLSIRYLMNRYLPDKAIDLLDEACARQSTLTEKLKNDDQYTDIKNELESVQWKIEKAILNQDYFKAAEYKEKEEQLKQRLSELRWKNTLPKHLRKNVEPENIGEVLSYKLWIPAESINASEVKKLKEIDRILKDKVYWQDEAVDAVVKAIRRNRLSVIDRTRPISSFLFLGPSGVGKTYIAQLLASEYFEDSKALIRVDMSEYMERNSSSKLIWSAPWYVGHEEWGMLTEQVKRKPYAVVLFDEIEKASQDVLNVLLQILDEGQLKDSKWKIIDFKNTIIILTSNIGSEEFSKKVPQIWFWPQWESKEKKDFEFTKEKVMEKLKDQISPELLNRIDYSIVFRPLSRNTLIDIFKKEYKEFADQWRQKKDIHPPKYSNKKIEKIVDEVQDPAYGARPIKRYIYENIEPEIINDLLEKYK